MATETTTETLRQRRTGAGKEAKLSKRLTEIDDLLLRLRAIKAELPSQDEEGAETSKNAKAAGNKDRFLEAKSEFLDGMRSVKDSLREMRDAKSTVRTRDQIARAQQVRGQLKELRKLLHEMETLYEREARKTRRRKVSAEEMETRAQFLRQFKQDLETLQRLSTKSSGVGGGASESEGDLEGGGAGSGAGLGLGLGLGGGSSGAGGSMFDTASFYRGLPSTGGAGPPSSGGPREVELTDMQQQGLEQIRQRDQQFDDILDQIGIAIERAGEQAKAMKDEAELQNKLLEKTEENVGKTEERIARLNEAMKKTLEEKGIGGERFCTNLMCFLLFLGIIGIIINVL